MSDKRQKNQLMLAFTDESRSEAPRVSEEGTESLAAKRGTESPAIGEQLMEEVCERENCKQALARVKANKGSPWCGWDDRPAVARAPETALASNPGTVVEWAISCAITPASSTSESASRIKPELT
jgi:hypothetical protein